MIDKTSPLAEQIAAVKRVIASFRNSVALGNLLLTPEVARIEAVLATLESVPALRAVVEAARIVADKAPAVVAEASRLMQVIGTSRELLIVANDLNTAMPALLKSLAAMPDNEPTAEALPAWAIEQARDFFHLLDSIGHHEGKEMGLARTLDAAYRRGNEEAVQILVAANEVALSSGRALRYDELIVSIRSLAPPQEAKTK